MTRANDGKQENKIHSFSDGTKQDIFIGSPVTFKGISVLLSFYLTIFLAIKEQYFYSLCGAALTLAAATSDRLKRIRIGRQGLHSEWNAACPPPGRKGERTGGGG